jgi:two-component system CheB/CheR fusion protein
MKARLPERRDDLATPTAGDAGANPILQALRTRALQPLSPRTRYAVALLGPLFSTLVQYVLLPEPSIAPFVFFYFSVALVSWLAGRGPGLLSVALSAAAANHLFVMPHRQWSLSQPALIATGLFVVGAAAVSLLCASFRDALLASQRTAAVLREQGELLRLSHDAIFVWRADGPIETWNHGAEELYGFTSDEARGRLPRDLLQTGFPSPRERIEATLREQGRWEGELEHRTRDGRLLTVSAKMQLVRGPDGVERVLATNRDITERKRAEEALRAANAQLIDSDQRKTEFLAMLSHELRNPLAPIRNSLYILDRVAPGGEQARRAQRVIERQVTHLARLVDDLLDVMRLTRGKTHLQLEPLDVADVVSHAADDHRAAFANAGLELELSVPARPVWIEGDRVRMAQLIGNLLSNAAKFTERGGKATISLEEDVGLGQAIIRVRDTGAGIAPEMLPRLFEPFVQADRSLARSSGGLGLGLAVAKGLVEMHDGTVSVSSEGLGRGAEFTVRLPLETSAPATETARGVTRTAPSRRVLVIEDNVDAADSLREVLELAGHAVDVAYTAEDGLARARASRPDVVLCDLGLPGMDGYEVARAIRADPALQGTMLVALTGYAAPEDVSRSREAGFDHHVAKPPASGVLEGLLASATTARPEADAAAAP